MFSSSVAMPFDLDVSAKIVIDHISGLKLFTDLKIGKRFRGHKNFLV